jgi:hypothetical protein
MPAIVSATVVRWGVVNRSGQAPVTYFMKSAPITVYVGDGAAENDKSGVIGVIAQYILDAGQAEREDLLKAARDGLLQVTSISRSPLTPPAVPPGSSADTPAD